MGSLSFKLLSKKEKKTFGIEKNVTNKNIKLTKTEIITPIKDHHLRNG